MAITITKSNFQSEVINSDVPVLVDFWAAWCGPCRMLSPIIEELSQEYEGRAKICKVNVDEELELASSFNVASIPTIVVFKNGKVVNTSLPNQALPQLRQCLIRERGIWGCLDCSQNQGLTRV